MKKDIKQRNIENSEISVSRSTSNGMKKKKNLFNKKIVYLGFFIIFSFLPICKAHAADFLQVVSSTGPTDNVATTSQTLNFSITFKAPQLTATPDATDTNYDVYFQPYCGTNSASGATYIVSSMSKVTAQNTTFTRSWTLPNGGGCPLGTKTFRWELYEVNNAGGKIHSYADKSFTYGIDTNYQGYYYIYQKPNGTYYLFSVAGRFADQQLCTTDADNFVAQNPDYTIYKACQYYDSIPATNTAEFVNISAQKDTTSTAGTYTLLAPIGGMTTAPNNIGDYFNKIFLIAIGLCGALAVIMIVIGGVQYMGDESIFAKTEAKSQIKNAILGLLIALAAYVLLNTINPDLLGKGVHIQQVSAAIDDSPILVESSTPTMGVAVGTNGLCPEGLSPVVIGGATIMHTCASITAKITNLINTAASQGIILGGKSYRSNTDQMALRVKNCAIPLTTPSSQCIPPTAIAGISMHESGLAIDFQCEGQSIQTKDNKCFIWLSQNAGPGLINFAKEPWHWSTNGK